MDKIQAFLVTAGRKDLAQEYFDKIAANPHQPDRLPIMDQSNRWQKIFESAPDYGKMAPGEFSKLLKKVRQETQTVSDERPFREVRKLPVYKRILEIGKTVNDKGEVIRDGFIELGGTKDDTPINHKPEKDDDKDKKQTVMLVFERGAWTPEYKRLKGNENDAKYGAYIIKNNGVIKKKLYSKEEHSRAGGRWVADEDVQAEYKKETGEKGKALKTLEDWDNKLQQLEQIILKDEKDWHSGGKNNDSMDKVLERLRERKRLEKLNPQPEKKEEIAPAPVKEFHKPTDREEKTLLNMPYQQLDAEDKKEMEYLLKRRQWRRDHPGEKPSEK